MAMDVWGKLWDLATSEEGGPARIEPDPDDAGTVTLVWPDGSRGVFIWHGGDWHHAEALSLCPGDVGARDAL